MKTGIVRLNTYGWTSVDNKRKIAGMSTNRDPSDLSAKHDASDESDESDENGANDASGGNGVDDEDRRTTEM